MNVSGSHKDMKGGSEFRKLHINQRHVGLEKSKNFLALRGDLTPMPTLIL